MQISKKQLKFIKLVEKCEYLFRGEVNFQEYPESLIDSLINKGLLKETNSGKLTSSTN